MNNDLPVAIMNLPVKNAAVTHDYRCGHRDARHAAAELVASQEGEPHAAVEAIIFALSIGSEGYDFLRAWTAGDFEVIRCEWPEAPLSAFVGADRLFKSA